MAAQIGPTLLSIGDDAVVVRVFVSRAFAGGRDDGVFYHDILAFGRDGGRTQAAVVVARLVADVDRRAVDSEATVRLEGDVGRALRVHVQAGIRVAGNRGIAFDVNLAVHVVLAG